MNDKQLEKRPSFGIKPFLFEQETLSSYLHRVADLNGVSYKALIMEIINDPSNRTGAQRLCNYIRGYRIDLLPSAYVDINALATVIEKNNLEILDHSLFNLYLKLYKSGFEDENSFFSMITKIYNVRERIFCPICIKGNRGVYKLDWQFYGSNICEKHKCKLVNKCIECNAVQKYIHAHLGTGRCSNCKKILLGEFIPITDYRVRSDHIKFMRNIHFLINPETEIFPRINGNSKKNSSLITLLYVVQSFNSKELNELRFNVASVLSNFTNYYVDLIIKSIAGLNNYSITFHMLIRYLKKYNMNFTEFSKISVPKTYIDTLYEYIDKRCLSFRYHKKPNCKINWCPSYKSDYSMQKLNKNYLFYNGKRYSFPCICMGCFIRYGYDPSSKTWDTISNKISHYNEIREQINNDIPMISLIKNFHTTHNLICMVIGYLLRFSLLDSMATKKFIKKITPLDNLYEIYGGLSDNLSKSSLKIIKKYNLHPINFYYHYFSSEVQNMIYFNIEVSEDSEDRRGILSQAKEFIEECITSGERITIGLFLKKNKVNRLKARQLGVFDLLKKAKENQIKQLKQQKENQLIDKVNYLFSQSPGVIIHVYKACEEIGYYNIKYVQRYLPGVYKRISELSKQSIIDSQKRRIEELKSNMKYIIINELEDTGQFPNISHIAKELKLKRKIYTEKYREVYEYYSFLKE